MDSAKVFIDIDDEITFILERVIASQAERVVIIIPERAAILSSLASMKLLYYALAKDGKKVIIVTMDEAGKNVAQKAGFIVRGRVGEVDSLIWNEFENENEDEKADSVKDPIQEEPELDLVYKNDKEISLNDVKQINPLIDEIDEIFEDKDSKLRKEEKIEKTDNNKPKFVESARIVKLDGFELVVGGDVASLRKSREVERKVVAKQVDTIYSFHTDYKESGGEGITGKDIEASTSKKKTKSLAMKTLQNVNKNVKKNKYFNKWIITGVVIVLIFLFIFSFIFMTSSVVSIAVKARHLADTSEVVANINNLSVDTKSKSIPAYFVEYNESSSSSAPTTGSKDVGNKANGNVTIYNLGTQKVVIPKGTVFITNDQNAFKYTLDNDVTIDGVVGAPQSQSGTLSAADIGPKYNIPANTPFTVNTVSSVSATSSSTFQGGTSSKAQVVSQSDQDTLLKSLEQQLYSKGQSDLLNTKIGADDYPVKSSITNQDISKSFDSNVDDKASILNLSLTTKTTILVYKKADLLKYASNVLTQSMGKDETLSDVTVSNDFKSYNSAKNNSGDIKLVINSSAFADPIFDQNQIKTNIKGKQVSSAISYIKSLNGVTDAHVANQPFWFGIFGLMPVRGSVIKINVLTK